MSTILRNTASGTSARMYRWNSKILRTPITFRIRPDQKKIYMIGNPATNNAAGEPTHGFVYQGIDLTAVRIVGWRLINRMINEQPPWLDASGAHDPEFVWYQGAYSTSQLTWQQGKLYSEAYASLAGFHFTVPSSARGHIQAVKVNYLNMGATWAYGPAIDHNVRNKNIKNADFGWDTAGFYVNMHFLNTETCNYHQSVINTYPYNTIDLANVGGAGDFRGERDIWSIGGQVGVVDGRIPTLTTPVEQSYYLSGTILSQFKSNNGGWFVPSIVPTLNSLDDYRPCSGWSPDYGNQVNYWACASMRDVTVDVELDIGE